MKYIFTIKNIKSYLGTVGTGNGNGCKQYKFAYCYHSFAAFVLYFVI